MNVKTAFPVMYFSPNMNKGTRAYKTRQCTVSGVFIDKNVTAHSSRVLSMVVAAN